MGDEPTPPPAYSGPDRRTRERSPEQLEDQWHLRHTNPSGLPADHPHRNAAYERAGQEPPPPPAQRPAAAEPEPSGSTTETPSAEVLNEIDETP